MIRIIRRSALIAFCIILQGTAPSWGQTVKETAGLIYVNFLSQPSPSKEAVFNLIRQARWDSGAGEQNSQGFRLRFEKVEDQAQSSALPRYRVFADGAPENKIYSLGTWLVGKELSYGPQEIYVNAQGLLMIHRPTPAQETSFKAPGDELNVVPEAGSAEPVRYILTSKDQELSVLGTIVPHPVIAQDQECTLEVRIAAPDAAAVLVVADRFPPLTKVPIVLESEGKTSSPVMTTDSGGHTEVASFPFVRGKTQGMLKATAEGSNCLPSVTLPWGANTLVKKTP